MTAWEQLTGGYTAYSLNTTFNHNSIATKGEFDKNSTNPEAWLKDVASASGLVHKELVSVHEPNLIEKGLITERTHSDRSGSRSTKYYRLTGMGVEICKYIETYEKEITVQTDVGIRPNNSD